MGQILTVSKPLYDLCAGTANPTMMQHPPRPVVFKTKIEERHALLDDHTDDYRQRAANRALDLRA